MAKKILPIIVVVLFAFIAGFGLIPSGLYPTHDGEYHIIRFYEFSQALALDNWYPRLAYDLNNGYSVPLFNYVYPLPNYVAAFLHFFGVSFINAFKIEMFAAGVIAAIFFYLWAKQFWGVTGAIVSSVFYTFSPYHFVDVYIRGSVGEVWALAFFPAFLWSITNFFKEKKWSYGVIASIFLSLVIFSHNILALMFFLFAISYILFLSFKSGWNRQFLISTFFIILISIGITAIFWMPALLENNYVKGLQIYNVHENFADLYQLLIPSWGSGFSNAGLDNMMSLQVGIANLFAMVLSLFVVVYSAIRKKKNMEIIFFFLIWFFIVFFLMQSSSAFFWDHIPLFNFFQFPWRFLSLEILICSFLAGSIFVLFQKRSIIKITVAAFLIALSVLAGIGYAHPPHYFQRDDNYYISRSNFIDGTNSPGNLFNTIWFKNELPKQKSKFVAKQGVSFTNEKDMRSKIEAEVNAEKDAVIQINIAYFPGWKAYQDKKEVTVTASSQGLLQLPITAGHHLLLVTFEDTLIRRIATVITIASICVLFYIYVRKAMIQ